MDVLKILWEHSPSNVRFVHDKLNEQREVAVYTSTLKRMQVMKEKGMLDRDESRMKHVYSAVVKENKIKGTLLDRFMDNLYNQRQGAIGQFRAGIDRLHPVQQ